MPVIRSSPSAKKVRRTAFRLLCETLEQRLPLATFLVTSEADSGPGTLRQAIAQANATAVADEITFAADVHRVILTSGQLQVTNEITIGGSADVEISRSSGAKTPQFRLFDISPGAAVTLNRLTLVNGFENQGGAIRNQGTLTLVSSTLRNNVSRVDGGAVYNQSGQLNVIASVFEANQAGNSGGAIADYGSLSIDTSVFSANLAGNQGGAIFEAGRSKIAFGTFTGNSANWGGGVYVRNQGEVSLDSSTLDSNSARFGGAIGNLGTVTAIQTTFSANSAIQLGGAIRNQGDLSVAFSTIAGNAASTGGGIDNRSQATLIGTIVADSLSGADLNGRFSGSNNLIEDGSGTGLTATIVADPKLGPLADNGGPTKTQSLLFGSPAINAGSNALAVDAQGNPLTYDQRGAGFARILGGTVDIGAVEFGETPSLIVTTALDVVDPTDGWTSLREAVTYANSLTGPHTVTFIAGLTGVWLTTGEIVISAQVNISGGSSGVTIARDTTANLPAFRLFRVDAGAVSRFDRLTLTGGSADETASVLASAGGAILSDGTLVIDTSTITSNQAKQHGGGILSRGSLNIVDSSISDNVAEYMGGGVFVWSAAITTITGSLITGNKAVEGGGISNYGKTTIIDTEVIANTAQGWFGGGGLRNGGSGTYDIRGGQIRDNVSLGQGGGLTNFGISTIDGTRFTGNSAAGKGGGAIANGNSMLILSNLVFENNSTTANGGAIYSEGKITGTGLTFSENSAAQTGGAVHATNAGLFSTFRDSSFIGNKAADGGALWNIATVQLTATNFLNNVTTTGSGGAIANFGTASVTDSELRGNSAKSVGGAIFNHGTMTIAEVSLIGNMAAGWSGGALFNEGDLTIESSTIRENRGNTGGGLMNFAGGKAMVIDTTIVSNTAIVSGGGIFSTTSGSGMLTLIGGTCSVNQASYGAGIFVYTGKASISGALISGNLASQNGGGLYVGIQASSDVTGVRLIDNQGLFSGGVQNDGLLTLSDSTLQGNRATSWVGGGIANSGTLKLSGSSLANNTAMNGGGGAIANSGTAEVTDCDLRQNIARDVGGAIYSTGTMKVTGTTLTGNVVTGWAGGALFNEGNLTIESSTIRENRANTGGGLSNLSGGKTTIIDTTIVSNTASGSGGGIFSEANSSGMLTLIGGSVANNTASGTGGGMLINSGILTVTGGSFFGNQATYGGGIFVHTGNATFTGTLISSNSSVQDGGGMYLGSQTIVVATGIRLANNLGSYAAGVQNAGNFTLTNSTLDGNRTTGWVGGGILNGGTLTVTGSTLTNNSAPNSGGGAIANFGTATVTGSDLSRNTGRDVGGAVYNAGSMTVSGSTLTGNVVTGWAGGALFNEGNLTIRSSTVRDNRTAYDGGAVFNTTAGVLTVEASSFIANSASNSGGAILNTGTFNSTNSTYGENRAGNLGGAIYNNGRATILQNTIAFNSASNGGGIFNESPGTVNLRNSIVANSLSGGDLRGIFSGSKNLVRDGSGTGLTGTIVADPLLGTLQDNGGPTWTYALPVNSPAVNAGSNALAVDSQGNSLAYDQRGAGFARIMGGTVDLGSFEFVEAPSLVVTTADDLVNPTDGWTSLREAVTYANSLTGPHTVTFAAGLTGVWLTAGEVVITSQVNVSGGSSGVTIARDTTANLPAFRLFRIDAGANSRFDRLTLKGGSADESASVVASAGGAILSDGTLVIDTCTITSNQAKQYGGGIYGRGIVNIVASTFTNNVSLNRGGGVLLEDSAVSTIDVSVFAGNSAVLGGAILNYGMARITGGSFSENHASLHGGAIRNVGEIEVDGTLFTNNDTVYAGGAIANRGKATVTGSRFIGNSSVISIGGAINSDSGANLEVRGSVFENNKSQIHGGAISVAGPTTISDSTFIGNHASDWAGGAIFNAGTLTVNRVTFTGNSAPDGGAVMNWQAGNLSIQGSTFEGNASSSGGAISNESTLAVTNVLFRSNSAQYFGGVLDNRSVATITDSQFVGNKANEGGAIGNRAELTLARSTFQNNQATGWIGGALENLANGRITVSGTAFSGNSAHSGGAIYSAGTLSVLSSNFSNNTAWGWGGGAIRSDWGSTLSVQATSFVENAAPIGGGIAASGTTFVNGASFTGNRANGWAGAGVFNEGTLELSDSQFSLGYAIGGGGALLNYTGGKANVRNTQMTGATGPCGGGVYNFGTVTLTQVTIVDNQATGYGAGIINEGSATLVDTNVTNNVLPTSAWTGGGIFNGASATLSVTGGLISGNSAPGGGGFANFGVLSLTGTTVRDNQASLWSGGGGSNEANATLNISGGVVSGNYAQNTGGAIYNAGTTTITGGTISGNRASNVAGGLDNRGTMTITGSTLSGNVVTAWAGGALFNEGNLTIRSSQITSNRAIEGGGIFNSGPGQLTAEDITFSGNTGLTGGGIFNRAKATVTGSTFQNNSSTSYSGGAVFNTGAGDFAVSTSTFRNNSSAYEGGGISSEAGNITILASTFVGNSAQSGGAIANRGTLTSTNSTYGENRAVWVGGAIYNIGTATILNNTIAFNSANEGGGIYIGSPGTVNLRNSIVANSLSGGDLRGIFSGSKNLVRDGSGTGLTGTIVADPLLGTLQDNGGPTWTYALLAGSAAIDAGDDSFVPFSITTDQRGTGRPRIRGLAVDLGAYEF
ncbi:hypothetical protein GC170_21065 [bacterium]|nr:hypothetical protein [bacterium]